MTGPGDILDDLAPDTPDDVAQLGERLLHERPLPTAMFRGELRRRLGAQQARRLRPRQLMASYASAGGLLLCAGALSAIGLGPLAA
jgi:hypothetical protein